MSYYMGDYYRGGFFGSLWGGIKGLAKGVLGIPSAPKMVGPTMQQMALPGAGYGPMATNVIRGGKAFLSKHPVLSAAAGAGVLAMAGGGAALARRGKAGVGTGLPAHLRGGGGRRRMHVTNVKALRRALRRTHGFAKLAMKVIRIEHPRKHGKFGGFKKRKRARV
jgi:hypothetical protein